MGSVPARVAAVLDRVNLGDLGVGTVGGSGALTLVASMVGLCPFCVVGLPCPVCALGAAPVIGGLFGGAGASSALGNHGSSCGCDGDDCACGD